MRAPTDKDLADAFLDSQYGEFYRKYGRHWELLEYIRDFLRPFAFFDNIDPIEAEQAAQRIAYIIRSRNAKKAARTRKLRAERKKKEEEKKKTEPFLPGLEETK